MGVAVVLKAPCPLKKYSFYSIREQTSGLFCSHLYLRLINHSCNCKSHQRDLHRIKVYASMSQNRFCFKSLPYNPPTRQLSWFYPCWPYWLSCLAGGFYALKSGISNKIYSEFRKHALQFCKVLVDGFSISLKSSQCTVAQRQLHSIFLFVNGAFPNGVLNIQFGMFRTSKVGWKYVITLGWIKLISSRVHWNSQSFI